MPDHCVALDVGSLHCDLINRKLVSPNRSSWTVGEIGPRLDPYGDRLRFAESIVCAASAVDTRQLSSLSTAIFPLDHTTHTSTFIWRPP